MRKNRSPLAKKENCLLTVKKYSTFWDTIHNIVSDITIEKINEYFKVCDEKIK